MRAEGGCETLGASMLLAAALVACGQADSGDGPGGVGGEAGAGVGAVAGTGGAPGGTGPVGGQAMTTPDGSWDNPLLIDALPFTDVNDTSAGASVAESYWPCAPETTEGGPEVVYSITLEEPAWLWAEVDDIGGDAVDVDVHLLAAADETTCVTRNDVMLGSPVLPGTYYIVVDTWSDAGYAGPYELVVDATVGDGDDCLMSPIQCDEALPPFINIFGEEQPGDLGCLPGMARVTGTNGDFCIDRYEGIVVAATDQGWMPVSPYAHPDASWVLAALSVEGAVPQGHISQTQAADACNAAGKRLCFDDEWLRACQGASGQQYPYGDALQPGLCNDARACHPVVQYFESTDSWIWSELGHTCISQLPDGLSATGAHAGCISDDGAFDMMGNLHEWTADPAGTFRGGFYVDTQINGLGCSYATTAHSVGHHDYSTGFRCCADVM